MKIVSNNKVINSEFKLKKKKKIISSQKKINNEFCV